MRGRCSGRPGGAGGAVACSVPLQPSCPTPTGRGPERRSTWVNTRSLGPRGSGGRGRQRPLQRAARRLEARGPPAICSALERRRRAGTAVPWRRHLQTSRSPRRPGLRRLVPSASACLAPWLGSRSLAHSVPKPLPAASPRSQKTLEASIPP